MRSPWPWGLLLLSFPARRSRCLCAPFGCDQSTSQPRRRPSFYATSAGLSLLGSHCPCDVISGSIRRSAGLSGAFRDRLPHGCHRPGTCLHTFGGCSESGRFQRLLSQISKPLYASRDTAADNVGARFDHFARGFRRRLNGRPSSLRCLSRPFSCHREASSQGSPGILRHLQMTAADFHYDRYSVFERWKRRVNIADLPQSIRPVLLRLVGLRTLRPKLPTIPRDSLRMAAEARLATCHQCTK